MAGESYSDILLKLGFVAFGVGLISYPFLGSEISLNDRPPSPQEAHGAPQLCPGGIAVQPYCLADSGVTGVGLGSALLSEFYGVKPDALSDRTACGAPVRILIATLPDPLGSNLSNYFDTGLYAIGRAHERAGFLLDRQSIPWDPGGADPSASAFPGAVLYRSADANPFRPQLSLVYLVPETPVTGVNERAFRRVLTDIDRLTHGCSFRQLRVIGPYFSGSSQSFARVIAQLNPAVFPRVLLLSGSATAYGNLRLNQDTVGPVITFRATVHSDRAYQMALDSLLIRLDLKPERVARLVEQATGYGHSISRSDSVAKGPIDIRFPMSIATIRAAYQASEDAARKDKTSTLGLGPTVELDSRELARPAGGIPIFSGGTVATQELFLDEIARTLINRGTLLVGLQATDVRDKLFLAQELHRRLPHLRFYTFESNLLYLRPEYSGAMFGTIVLSTYPLVSDPVGTSQADLLPSDPSAGIYNATLALMDQDSLMTYAHSLAPGAASTTLGPPVWATVVGSGRMMPLAVWGDTASGSYRRDLDSLYLYPATYVDRIDPRVRWNPPPKTLLRCLVLFLSILVAWSPRLLPWKGWNRRGAGLPPVALPWPPWRLFGRRRPDEVLPNPVPYFVAESKFMDAFSRFAVLTALALAWIIFSPPADPDLKGIAATQWWLITLAGLIPLALMVAAVIQQAWRLPRGNLRALYARSVFGGIPEAFVRLIIMAAGAGFIFGAVAMIIGVIEIARDPEASSLLWYRARAMDGRASPLLPIMLIGLMTGLWCAWHRRRATLLRRRTTVEQALDCGCDHRLTTFAPVWSRISLGAQGIRWRLALLTPTWPATITVAGALCGAVLLAGSVQSSLESAVVEHRKLLHNSGPFHVGFETLLWFGLVAGLVLTVISVERLTELWKTLKEFLGHLDRLPIRTAFERMPPEAMRIARLLPRSFGKRRLQWVGHEYRWGQLINLTTAGEQDPRSSVEADELAEALKATSSRLRLARLAALLSWYWSQEPMSAAAEQVQSAVSKSGGPKEPLSGVEGDLHRNTPDRSTMWIRVAEEYVAAELVEYVDWAMDGIRWIALFLVAASVCTSILLLSYPIMQERFVHFTYVVVLAGTVIVLSWTTMEINRNPMISRLSGTTPGQLNLDRSLITNGLVFVGLPLLSYFGSAVPALRGMLLGWLGPLVGGFLHK